MRKDLIKIKLSVILIFIAYHRVLKHIEVHSDYHFQQCLPFLSLSLSLFYGFVTETSCAGGRHNIPSPPASYLWPFDLENGFRVTCVMGYPCANFSLPRPLCSRLRPLDRLTDVRRTSSLNASLSLFYMLVTETSCAGGRHNIPRPLQVDLWPFDLESGIFVTCDMGTPVPILVFLGLSVLDLGPSTDWQTSDTHHRLMPPPYGGGGIMWRIFAVTCLFAFLDYYGVAVMLHLNILDLSAVRDNFVLARLIGFLP